VQVTVVGSHGSADTLRVREFLSRNGVQYTYVDLTDREARGQLAKAKVKAEDIPVVAADGKVMRNPANERLADALGLVPRISTDEVFDLIVVGTGPAGLAATVNAASEGLRTVSIERYAPGGQAGTSSRIENFLGFPQGLSGEELAHLARAQADKFGAVQVIARECVRITPEDNGRVYAITLNDGSRVWGRGAIIATGGRYKKPPIENVDRFTMQGVYFSATHTEAVLIKKDEDVIVVGAGNSAGQATMYLSTVAKHVFMLVRGDKPLEDTMSWYLISRIRETSNVTVLTRSEIVKLDGGEHLEDVTVKGPGGNTRMPVRHVFLMVGSDPATAWLECHPESDWLAGCISLDEHGFVKTRSDLTGNEWSLATVGRPPFPYETSLPRVFAVGDVRSQSVKRVASAVGEGSVCIHYAYRALAELGSRR
jgi:thioredoxin reductase (NADPH)